MNLLKRLAKVLSNFPMKSIFIMMIIVVLLAVGVKDVFMATGNDTLVEPSSDVYQDNLMLEEEFGGESIIVLYEAKNLLTPDYLKHMKGIEDALQNNDSIYSILSPVTLVEEIANNQSDTFQDGITETIDGLNEMGSQLTNISDELKGNAESNQEMALPELEEPELPELEEQSLPKLGETTSQLPEVGEIQLPDMEGQMAELNEGFSNIIGAQGNLEEGTTNLVDGYAEFGRQTNELGQNLSELSERMEDNPQKQQIQEASQGLIQLSQQMTQISEDSSQLPGIPEQTIEGLNNIQQKLDEQLNQQNGQLEQIQEQVEKQKEMQAQIQEGQQEKQEQMKQEMKEQQETQQEEMQAKMDEQRAEKEREMQGLKEEIVGKQTEQAEMLSQLADGLAEMGENLQTISENMKTIYDYSDIMTPGLPDNQATLDNMIYDDDDELRPMFEEVVIDDQYMIMMIKLNGDTEDAEKTEVIDTINSYLDTEEMESAETMVSGKPVLDHATRSSMQESIQTMMGLALIIMVIVLSIFFKVRWRLLPLVTVLIAVIGTVGLMGWLQIPITMVSMAVFPILIGLGIDYAIQFQNRYAEEMAKEDSNE